MSHCPRPPFAISGPSPSFGIPGALFGFSRARPAPFRIRVRPGLGYVAPSPPHGPAPFGIRVRPGLGYVAPSPPHGDPFHRPTFVI